MALAKIEPDEASSRLPTQCFGTLKELTRHGYVPDDRSPTASGAILFRHPSAPNLILREDGTLELPGEQPLKAMATSAPGLTKPSWKRALFIVALLAVYTFVSLAVMSTIISS